MPLAMLLALSLPLQAPEGTDLLLKVGDPAPPFAMRDLDNKVFSLRDHTGKDATAKKNAILLAFFATWCEPCKKEIPIVKKLHQRWKGKGRDVEVVYVGLSQGAKELAPFAKEAGLPWRVVPDSFGLLARRYGATQLPHLFIVDREGRIAFQHRGIAPDLSTTLEAQLMRITGQKPDEDPGPVQVDTPRFEKSLSLGRPPSSSGSAARWQPLAVFLSEAVGARVEPTTEPTYEAFEAALLAGKLDITNAGPLLAHKVRATYEPVARIERQGSPTYFGILFVPRQSPVRALADLRGKTVGLVAEHSSSGGLYAELALLDAGLVPGKDVTIKWLGDHSKVARAVKDGTVDAGGCYEDCRDAVWPDERAKGAATRVLSYTPEIPAEMILVKKALEPALKGKIATAVLAASKADGILAQISQGETSVTAFVASTPADLDAVAAALARVADATRK
jgi:phosphate/phosphite/phosphonate ABC transporter binding protein